MGWLRGGRHVDAEEGAGPSEGVRDGWRRFRPLSWLTFETYVVGSTNREQFDVAVEAAREPGKRCNPLFLYGDVGLGKTHLINAIGNEVASRGEERVVVYMPSVRFAEELLSAIERNELAPFKQRCLEIDLLLLEDVQFLARQRAVQEEFADLFALLCREGKQVVVTSDRPPQAVDTLSDRVRSAFSAGVIAGVDYPTLEMRAAILSRLVRQRGIELSDKLVVQIARRCGRNVRRLQGTASTLAALSRCGELPSEIALEQVLQSLPRGSESLEEERDG